MTQINTQINTHTVSATVKPTPNTPAKGLRATTFVRAGGNVESLEYMIGSLNLPVVVDLGNGQITSVKGNKS